MPAAEGGIEVTGIPAAAVAEGGAGLPQEGAPAEVRGEGVQDRGRAVVGGAEEAGGGDETRFGRQSAHKGLRA